MLMTSKEVWNLYDTGKIVKRSEEFIGDNMSINRVIIKKDYKYYGIYYIQYYYAFSGKKENWKFPGQVVQLYNLEIKEKTIKKKIKKFVKIEES